MTQQPQTTKSFWTKETAITTARHLLCAIGAFIVGSTLWGETLTYELYYGIAGCIVSVLSFVWSVLDKKEKVEMFESVARQVLTFVGGLAVARGKMKEETFQELLGVITAISPIIQSYLSRKKTDQVLQGEIPVQALKNSTYEIKEAA